MEKEQKKSLLKTDGACVSPAMDFVAKVLFLVFIASAIDSGIKYIIDFALFSENFVWDVSIICLSNLYTVFRYIFKPCLILVVVTMVAVLYGRYQIQTNYNFINQIFNLLPLFYDGQ